MEQTSSTKYRPTAEELRQELERVHRTRHRLLYLIPLLCVLAIVVIVLIYIAITSPVRLSADNEALGLKAGSYVTYVKQNTYQYEDEVLLGDGSIGTVLGLPGDQIFADPDSGEIFRDDEKVATVDPESVLNTQKAEVNLPDGYIFVSGIHTAAVATKSVRGSPAQVIWPLSERKTIDTVSKEGSSDAR